MSPNCATLEINLSALAHNYQLLKKKFSGGNCAGVVKANAYGLGMQAVSQALWKENCRQFFVATLAEGIELRAHLPGAEIYVFHGIQPGEEKEFPAHRLVPVLNSMEQVERFQGSEVRGQGSVLHIDTGMTRLGLSDSDLNKLLTRPLTSDLRYLMSHLACANEPGDPKNAEQLTRFRQALKFFPGAKASLANSSGIFLSPDYHFDVARPGCALYGINPVSGENPMRHVATLSAPILQIRTLDRDETVGYGATQPAKKGSRIAIVGFGYADGYMRALSNKGFAMIAGQKVPVAGRVSMDMTALDISSLPEGKITPGLRAEFINEKQTVNDVASAAGTIGYEVFSRLGPRVQRIYR